MEKILKHWDLQLTGNRNMTVGFSLFDHLENLLGTADEPLRGPFHVDHLVLVLVDSQVDLGCCREILLKL